MDKLFTKDTSRPMPEVIQRLLLQGKRSEVLRLLDRFIENDGGLFQNEHEFQEDRRLGWLLRIDLLRGWNRISEALAWTCFECEINPGNVTAIALKEQLKRQLNLSPPRRTITEVPINTLLDWKGVAGMRELKAVFERDIILPLLEPEIYEKYRVSLPNGILLYGPPGCGKTFITRKVAEEIGYTFKEIKPSDLASIYIHGTQEKIKNLFEEAKTQAPCIIFLDELEGLVPIRSSQGINHSYQSEVNEFLVQLNDCSKHKILVIGATNLPNMIDPAIRRPGRLDKKIFIAPPDLEARAEALKLYLKGRPQNEIEILQLAEQTECYTFAELEFIVDEAAREALTNRKPISTEILLKNILKNKPSLNFELIEKMRNAISK